MDGLILAAMLLSLFVLTIQGRAGMGGLTSSSMPLQALILGWAICASVWTFRPYEVQSWSHGVHLVSVYVGGLFFAVSGVASAMFLYGQRRLRRKRCFIGQRRFASLEAAESLIVWAASLGVGLLTVGLITGFVTYRPLLGGGAIPGHDPLPGVKIVLALLVWVTFVGVLATRRTTQIRGTKAAWLCLVGLVLMAITFWVVASRPDRKEVALGMAGPGWAARAASTFWGAGQGRPHDQVSAAAEVAQGAGY